MGVICYCVHMCRTTFFGILFSDMPGQSENSEPYLGMPHHGAVDFCAKRYPTRNISPPKLRCAMIVFRGCDHGRLCSVVFRVLRACCVEFTDRCAMLVVFRSCSVVFCCVPCVFRCVPCPHRVCSVWSAIRVGFDLIGFQSMFRVLFLELCEGPTPGGNTCIPKDACT